MIFVIAGLSRSKNSVASLAYGPGDPDNRGTALPFESR